MCVHVCICGSHRYISVGGSIDIQTAIAVDTENLE